MPHATRGGSREVLLGEINKIIISENTVLYCLPLGFLTEERHSRIQVFLFDLLYYDCLLAPESALAYHSALILGNSRYSHPM